MPKITIIRSSQYSNKIRDINLYLDTIKLGKIADGETMDFEITNGQHNLIAKIDWASSNKIQFEINDQDVTFKLSSTNPMLAIYYITLGRKNYLKLQRL